MSGFTFKVEEVDAEHGKIAHHEACAPTDLFATAELKKCRNLEAFYMSSALPVPLRNQDPSRWGTRFDHGLVQACLISFTQHKKLVLRPDDIFFPLVDAAAAHVINQGGTADADISSMYKTNANLRVIRFILQERALGKSS